MQRKPKRHDGKAPIEVTENLTIPKAWLDKCRQYGEHKVAMREKEFGIWQPYTWKDYYENVKSFCLGLKALGLKKGDIVAFIGDNRPHALWAEIAVLCAGGIPTWLFQDSLLDEVEYIFKHSEARFCIAEGQEEVDKCLWVKERCPKLEKVIWEDPKGMRYYQDPMLISYKEVQEMGREYAQKQHPDIFEKMITEGKADDTCLIFYTSGTTALPKGTVLTHRNMLSMGKNLLWVDPIPEDAEFLSFLPMAWIGEQMMSVSEGIIAGFAVNFPEKPEVFMENLREIGPRVMFSAPRNYEAMVRGCMVKYSDATWLKKKTWDLSMKIGYKVADMKFEKKGVPWYWKTVWWLSYWVNHRQVLDTLGLRKLKYAYTGGAPLGDEQFRFFHALGLNLKQIYGQTEISGISVIHRNEDIKFDTVGFPIPETEVRITDGNEIMSRSPCVFRGYYKMEEQTKKTLLRGGWLYSADTGFMDEDGHLICFDRSKDVMTLSDGSISAPQIIENRLKFSPYVQDAWVIGDKRPNVVAVICIDYGTVGRWAESKAIPYTSYPELSQIPEVNELMLDVVKKVNTRLPKGQRITKFVNFYKTFEADDDELTRTRKLRRGFMEERYKDVVDGLYGKTDYINLDTSITYEDGRVARLKYGMKVNFVSEGS
ncbi:MAG: long-chain fatty acid--CoA ligase [Chloroflexi bacterium]|nr:long-chain fatty acid--CoA ligase [Chloroflexota bacterium]